MRHWTYIEGRSRGPFLAIAMNRDPFKSRSPEEQSFHIHWVAVVVDNNGLVVGEQRVESIVGQGVGMRSTNTEDHQVGDIDDSNTKLGRVLAEKGCSSDNFERDFYTNANQDAV